MTTDRVRRLLRAAPFEPFEIHLADGRAIRVAHPELMAIAPSGRTATVFTPDDDLTIIDLLLVTTLDVPDHDDGSSSAA